MAEKKTVFKEAIKYDGHFVYKDLYASIYSTLKDLGFSIAENSYEEKSGGGGKEIKQEWKAKKKVTEYLLHIKWRAFWHPICLDPL